jgi:golgi-specific brefeldin A-resistance guanine nucleotide exchange factor 1
MRPPQAVVAKVEQSRDVGLFSTLTSYLASYASDEPPEPSEEELESTLTTLDCINACGLGDVFSNIA